MSGKDNACILLGYSGHAFVVAEAHLLSGGRLDRYADLLERTFNPFELIYAGSEQDENFPFWKKETSFILGIGNNAVRTKVAALVRHKGFDCAVVTHPSARVSSTTKVSAGTFIARNVAVNPFCTIGTDVILNTSCSIDHQCNIGNGVHVAPGAVLAGNVKVGERSFIGANSVIKQGVIIGNDVVVGAGAVVLHDIVSNETVVGNPARTLKKNKL